ncbi:hypothetical protein ColLi_04068 [Colletotrichum liriopes]|uniref:Uncharacterized protein n=1 Tax=Colletotrichum liriopes TaxID=708192 RepID=A0AA37GHV7_9PEZI|nr:hypothetical protein ColLi_04068 [Colletotrichum liriopes]
MDTIDRSVERMRLRAIELDRDCALKLAQLKALVASGPAAKPSADKSYDYSTDSPTPHTISNWDSSLEEDRLDSCSFAPMSAPSSPSPVPSGSVTPPCPSSPVLTRSRSCQMVVSGPFLYPRGLRVALFISAVGLVVLVVSDPLPC